MAKIKIWRSEGWRPSEKDVPERKDPAFTPNIQEILGELDSLIGLREIKKLIREIYAYVEIQKRRQREKLLSEPQVWHMIFKGNPGTGKTTVARIIGRLFKEMGILPKG
ncbi:MAG: stage V sporulation protein K, partial [Desulfotomaculales bacterium]